MSNHEQPQTDYDPPRVEQIPTEDGPAVTAAGKSPVPDSS